MRRLGCVVVIVCAVVVVVVGAAVDTTSTTMTMSTTSAQENVLQKPVVQHEAKESRNSTEKDFRQTWKKCFQKFSPSCAKLLLTRLTNNLPHARLQIAPGITLQANSSSSHSWPLELVELVVGVVTSPLSAVNVQLLGKARQLFDDVTVSVRLEDPALLRQVTSLTEEVVDGIVATAESEGRKKGNGGALLWSAGALAAVGFASVAAVAGKAMMASMMALMLAGMSALRGLGGGGGDGGGSKHSNIEIIKAPAHFEFAPAPQYEGSPAFEHDHYYTAPGGASATYEYGRMMTVSRPRADGAVLVNYKTSSPPVQ